MVKWYHESFPSSNCGFDSRYPLLYTEAPEPRSGAGSEAQPSWCGVSHAPAAPPASAHQRLRRPADGAPRRPRRHRSLAVILIAGLLAAPRADALTATSWCNRPTFTPHHGIDCVFPAHHRPRAHRIIECESTASAPERIARSRGLGRWARDYATGTHVGIFQLESRERRAHGWCAIGTPALLQVSPARSLPLTGRAAMGVPHTMDGTLGDAHPAPLHPPVGEQRKAAIATPRTT
ncbi:MAG: hypothetical protein JWM86_2355 [Thermoleophilia bacterium]|nr:hypothetical protein [Thermoleophilia bacterium]